MRKSIFLLCLVLLISASGIVSCDMFGGSDSSDDEGDTYTVSGTVTHSGVDGLDLVVAVFTAGADTETEDPIDSVTSTFSGGSATYLFSSAEAGTYDVYAIIDMDNTSDFSGPEPGDVLAQALGFVVDSNETGNFSEGSFSFVSNDTGVTYSVCGYVEHSDTVIAVDGKDVIIAGFPAGADTTVTDPIEVYETVMSGGRAYYSFPSADPGTYDVYAIIDMDNSTAFAGPETGDRINAVYNYVLAANAVDADFEEEEFDTYP